MTQLLRMNQVQIDAMPNSVHRIKIVRQIRLCTEPMPLRRRKEAAEPMLMEERGLEAATGGVLYKKVFLKISQN